MEDLIAKVRRAFVLASVSIFGAETKKWTPQFFTQFKGCKIDAEVKAVLYFFHAAKGISIVLSAALIVILTLSLGARRTNYGGSTVDLEMRLAAQTQRVLSISDKQYKLYSQYIGLEDSLELIPLADCTGPDFEEEPALRELVETVVIIFGNTWLPRDRISEKNHTLLDQAKVCGHTRYWASYSRRQKYALSSS